MRKLLLLFATFLTTILNAQPESSTHPCATPAHKSAWLKAYQTNPADYYRGASELLYVPLKIHSVGSDSGGGHMDLTKILNAICTLNEDFLTVDLQFYIEGDIIKHDNSAWYSHEWDGGEEMITTIHVDNTVNCFIVKDAAGACGYSWLNSVVLAKSCTGAGSHTWAHEIGHHLSLPHTFFGWEGHEHDYNTPAPESNTFSHDEEIEIPVEKMDGSNCLDASDGFCDTPPDYLNYRWPCDSASQSSLIQHDPDGIPFTSDGTFIMSYSYDDCASRFSDEQIAAMRAYIFDVEPGLVANQNPLPLSDVSTALLFPEDNALVSSEQLTLTWEAIPDMSYIVKVSRFPDFGYSVVNEHVSINSITVNLQADKEYYWRIKPFNSYAFCSPVTDFYTFTTMELQTGSHELADHKINIFPTLATPQEKITIYSDHNSMDGYNVQLFNTAGQLVFEQKSLQQNNVFSFNAPIQQGLYFLSVSSNEGHIVEKLIVK